MKFGLDQKTTVADEDGERDGNMRDGKVNWNERRSLDFFEQ